MNQSSQLSEFYRAYSKWLEEGSPHDVIFRRDTGLCSNLRHFNPNIVRELRYQFDNAGYKTDYPFNRDWREYHRESDAARCHLNAKRNQWVKDHLE